MENIPVPKKLTPEEHESLSSEYAELLDEKDKLVAIRTTSGENAHLIQDIEDPTYTDMGYTDQISEIDARLREIDTLINDHLSITTQTDTPQGKLDL